MKKLFITLIVAISIIASGCSKKEEHIDYTGTWGGTYTGDDSGWWTATIDEDGNVTGSATPNVVKAISLDLVGTITPDGDFTATVGSVSNGSVFTGEFTESNASGTWSNSSLSLSGTWTGEKLGDPLQQAK